MKLIPYLISILTILYLLFGGSVHAQPIVRPLLATEREVEEFIDKYIEHYIKKDVEGFLRFFSSKAIQNERERLPEIRETYSQFFNQSETLKYRMIDRKTEIYENAVEVKARYEIEQVLKRGKETKIWKGKGRWVLVKEGQDLKILSLHYQNEKVP